MKRFPIILVAALMAWLSSLPVCAQEVISLEGSWDYAVGDTARYHDYVMLPGSMQVEGMVKYRRGVYVPATWSKKHISLFLERPLSETTVYVNGQKAGCDSSLFVPHQFDVTDYIRFGTRNIIEVRAAHGAKDHWNGIAGRMELRAQPGGLYIKHVNIYPKPFEHTFQFELELGGYTRFHTFSQVEVMVQLEGNDSSEVYLGYANIDGKVVRAEMPIRSSVELWEEFHPQLYRVGFQVDDDYYETTFGMREVSIEDGQIILNRHPIFLRGVVENGYFPKTGYPPMDEAYWLRLFRKYKEYGLNYMRFKSYCPPDAAFAAADKVGFYLQPESGQPVGDHHPSFILPSHDPSLIASIEPSPEGLNVDSLVFYYKNEIERNLCNKDYNGFLLPSQWLEKGYINAKQWHQFCSPIVPLARFPKSVFTNTDSLAIPVDVYNAMFGDLENVRVSYYLNDSKEEVIKGGQIYAGNIPLGKNASVGEVRLPLDSIKNPEKLRLTVVAGHNRYKNQWDFWVHPNE